MNMKQQIVISKHFKSDLASSIAECERDKIFVLVDTYTHNTCWPLIQDYFSLKNAIVITIEASDAHKDLQSLCHVWECLEAGKATRHSLLINLGGGMVTDLGGFAASTFKRGINFINVPTTLLAMVDASVGGKTGINFGGLKNEIGVFNEASCVLLNMRWLRSLDAENLRSGYAEMLKHGLISNEATWAELIKMDLSAPDLDVLADMVGTSVKVKENFVTKDPHEHGIRKALNFGHTFGHALEEWSLHRTETSQTDNHIKPLLHGYAIAFGLICELYLSAIKTGFPTEQMHQTINFIRQYYGQVDITCDDYAQLIDLMHHDKKSTSGEINATLLSNIGKININQTITEEEAKDAFDFLREG